MTVGITKRRADRYFALPKFGVKGGVLAPFFGIKLSAGV